jgi:hypothetical protein
MVPFEALKWVGRCHSQQELWVQLSVQRLRLAPLVMLQWDLAQQEHYHRPLPVLGLVRVGSLVS